MMQPAASCGVVCSATDLVNNVEMVSKRKSNTPKRTRSGSLLSPESTGGITAGSGLDFQLRYVVCHLPLWLRQDEFYQLFFEGTGDIDVRFSGQPTSSRRHIQIKD